MKAHFAVAAFLIGRLLIALALLAAGSRAHAGPTANAGAYRVELTTDPAVIPVGKAKLQVKLTDASGKPVEGATLRAMTKMPTMNMGEREQSSTPRDAEPGVYDIPAQFAMEGGYESTIQITGPLGKATARIPLETGQNTTAAKSASHSVLPLLLWGTGILAILAFVLYRVRKTGQQVNWKGILNRQVFGSLLLLAIIAAGAYFAVKHLRRPGALTPIEAQAMDMSYLPPPPGYAPVELATVTRGAVQSRVRYTGTAVGFVEQDVYPRVPGTLLYMPLYAGDRVRKGQVIARLDTSQTQPQVAQQEAAAGMARQGVNVARAEVEQAQAEVEQAHAELAGKQGAISEAKAQVEAATEDRVNADAALAAAQAQVADAEAQIAAAKADQTYWRTQIERAASLLKAGAISGEEYQKDKAQADTAEAKVHQAEARLTQVNAEVKAAQATRRRADAQITAARSKVQMAQSELDAHIAHVRSARAAVTTVRRKVGQAQSGAAQAQAALQSATVARGYSEIQAQTDGVVIQRLVSPGVLVAPGQAIVRIAQIDPIRLQANVAEADIARLRIGGMVQVSGRDDNGRKPLPARITSIAPAVDPAARTGLVEAVVPNPNRRFLPGQYIVLEFDTGGRAIQSALRVPTRAVQYRTPAAAEGAVITTKSQPFVWVAEPSGQAGQYTVHRVDVTLGGQGEQMTEVASGLKEGQQVVVSGGTYLKDEDTVAEVKEATGGSAETAPSVSVASPTAGVGGGQTQTAKITVTAQGFEPASVDLKAGIPAKITFTRLTDQTCATDVVFSDYGIKKVLPLNQPVTVEFTPKKGEIGYACGMDMIKGKVVAR